MYYDSHVALRLAKNPIYRNQTKHIDDNFISHVIAEDMFSIQKIGTKENLTYMLTRTTDEEVQAFLELDECSWR